MRKGQHSFGRRLQGGRRTVGSIYEVQPLGAVSDPSSPMGQIVPVLAGAIATAGTTLGLRFGMASTTQTQQKVQKVAPYIGLGVGGLVALIFGYSTGKASGMGAGAAAVATTGLTLTSDWAAGKKLAQISPDAAKMMAPYGLGAIVAEYGNQPGRPRQLGAGNRMGEIIWQKQNTRGVGDLGARGDVVQLRGVNQGAYGTPGFTVSR